MHTNREPTMECDVQLTLDQHWADAVLKRWDQRWPTHLPTWANTVAEVTPMLAQQQHAIWDINGWKYVVS